MWRQYSELVDAFDRTYLEVFWSHGVMPLKEIIRNLAPPLSLSFASQPS
jgi:F0F1-type ATP synthase membrane subunit a